MRYNYISTTLLLVLSLITQSCSRQSGSEAYDYYLQGQACLDMLNYPEAMVAFLHAEKLAEKYGNDSVLALSLHGMMDLSDSICDINGKAHYAIKACDVYNRHNDYDNMYAVLSDLAKLQTIDEAPYQYAEGLIHYASILLANDTTRAYFYADTLERRSERLYHKLDRIGSLDVSSWNFIESTKCFNPNILIEKIKNDDGWREEIDNDSSYIPARYAHIIATSLWDYGLNDKARDFIDYYRTHYADKIINSYIDTASHRVKSRIAYRLNDTCKQEFRSTFQEDVKAAVTRFHYEEETLHEQTIRFQRSLIISMAATAIAVIAAIAIYVRMTLQRRRHRQERDMLSASELRTALHKLEEQHLATLGRLCETYYENYTDESTKSKTARDTLNAIVEMAESESFIRRLESHLDDTADGLMSHMRTELPEIKEQDRRLFLYNALGLSIPTICLLLSEKREVIYNRRLRLRAKIQESEAPHKDAFLDRLR